MVLLETTNDKPVSQFPNTKVVWKLWCSICIFSISFTHISHYLLSTQIHLTLLDKSYQSIIFILQFMLIRKSFRHRNVLGVVGISMNEENVPLIITPYMSGGSLSNKLKTQVFEKTKIMYSKISGSSITNIATILWRNGVRTSISAPTRICALRFGRAKLHVRNYYLLLSK